MVDYIQIDDSEVEPEAPLISSLGVRWRDNPIAIAEGAPDAPRIQTAALEDSAVTQSKIEDSAVTQSKLKTTTATQSTSVDGGNSNTFTVTGGTHSLAWFVGGVDFSIRGHPDEYATKVRAYNVTGSIEETYFYNRYIQSSPPYDFGDGIVMGFIYLKLDDDGNITGTYIAEDPPWYGNTRNRAVKQYKAKDGKEYAEYRKSKHQRTKELEDFGVIETETKEITSELKLEGMDELPQPFEFEAEEDMNIILLDPVDEDLTFRITNEMLAGGEYMEILRDYMVIDNEQLEKRKGPPGVPVHEVKWRKT